jgi:hypothetical protein
MKFKDTTRAGGQACPIFWMCAAIAILSAATTGTSKILGKSLRPAVSQVVAAFGAVDPTYCAGKKQDTRAGCRAVITPARPPCWKTTRNSFLKHKQSSDQTHPGAGPGRRVFYRAMTTAIHPAFSGEFKQTTLKFHRIFCKPLSGKGFCQFPAS